MSNKEPKIKELKEWAEDNNLPFELIKGTHVHRTAPDAALACVEHESFTVLL